jgi:hypothetical protein
MKRGSNLDNFLMQSVWGMQTSTSHTGTTLHKLRHELLRPVKFSGFELHWNLFPVMPTSCPTELTFAPFTWSHSIVCTQWHPPFC